MEGLHHSVRGQFQHVHQCAWGVNAYGGQINTNYFDLGRAPYVLDGVKSSLTRRLSRPRYPLMCGCVCVCVCGWGGVVLTAAS